MINDYKYLAFISYKREDEKWAKWLQYKLEHYKLPSSLRKTDPSLPKRARPVFRDITDLSGGVLDKAIKEALNLSKYLIVICSPRAAQSPWVCKEVQEFIDSGREEYIIPFIIEGEINSSDIATECFPENLKELKGSRELLGININEMGRNAAAIKVVARMFFLQFDTLWQRWKRERQMYRRYIIGLSLLGVVISFSIVGIIAYQYRKIQINQARAVAYRATQLIEEGNSYLAQKLLVEVLPTKSDLIERPFVAEAEEALRKACDYNTTVIGGYSYADNSNFSTFSPDGRYILSSNSAGYIKLWNVEDGTCIKKLKAHESEVLMAAFDPTGRYIVTGSTDRCIKLWDTESWKCLKTLYIGCFSRFVIFSPNGKYIVSNAVEDNGFMLLEVESLNIIRTFKGHDDIVTFASFSPDSKYVVSSSADNTIKLWDVESEACLKTFKGHDYCVSSVVFSPDGRYFVSASHDKTIKLWDIESKSCRRTFMGHDAHVRYAFFSPDSKYVVSSSADNTIKLWDVKSNVCLKTFENHTNTVCSACFSPDGRSIVSSSWDDRTVVLYDLKDILNIGSFEHEDGWCYSTAISHDCNTIASTSMNKLNIWDICSKRCIKTCLNDSFDFVEYTSDDKYVLTVSEYEEFKLWNAQTMECILSFGDSIKDDRIMCTSFASASNKLVAGYQSGQIKIWNIISGECVTCIASENRGYLNSVEYSSNGKYIVAASMNNVLLYDAVSGVCVDIIDRLSPPLISSTCFTPDGNDIIYVLYDGTIEKYNLKRRENTLVVKGNSGDVGCSAISPDGRYFSYAFNSKGTYGIKLIDLETKSCVRTFTSYKGRINRIVYSADGHWIVSACDDGAVKLEDGRALHELMNQVRTKFKNNPLTNMERKEFFLE